MFSPNSSIAPQIRRLATSAGLAVSDERRLLDLLFWSGHQITLKEYQSVLSELTDAGRTKALESITKQGINTLMELCEKNHEAHVGFVMSIPMRYEYLWKRLFLWFVFFPNAFINFFVPGASEARKGLRRVIGVAWGTSCFVCGWVFYNIPSAIYCMGGFRSYQLEAQIAGVYFLYYAVLTIPYCIRETLAMAREVYGRTGILADDWMCLKYRAVKKGYDGSTTTDLASFLVEVTKATESKFWATRMPAHFVRMEKIGTKLSILDAKKVDKNVNVYSQSAKKQVM